MMEVMSLKHGFSLVIIILLCHNVALQSPEKEYPGSSGDTISQGESWHDVHYSMEMEENLMVPIGERDNLIVPKREKTPGENLTEPIRDKTPEENLTVPIRDKTPEENLTVPIRDKTPEENLTVSKEKETPGKNGTVSEEEEIPEEHESVSEEEAISGEKEILETKPATFRWPSGTVPYHIRRRDYDGIIIARIRAAMQEIERSSCVIFKDVSRDKDAKNDHTPWLSIENPGAERECSHTTLREVGNTKHTKAILTLGYDCMQYRDILHALLHALGFADEVTHPQRDKYVRIVWPNIKPEFRPYFFIKKSEIPQTMVEYDSMSVMHFHDRAYTVNGKATIVPQVPGLLIAPSDTLSQLDVMKLRISFGHVCNKRKVADLYETCHNALTND